MTRTSERRAQRAKAQNEKTYSFLIHWQEIDEDEDPEKDLPAQHARGWYINVQCGDENFDLGPWSFEDDGFPTVDAALEYIKKWAEDRAVEFITPAITFTLKTKPQRKDHQL